MRSFAVAASSASSPHAADAPLMTAAAIFGCAGPVLSGAERDFFRQVDPWGFILFARNIETPDQVRALTTALRDSVGRDAPILIDQEGGRVARLRPPQWRGWGPALDTADAAGLTEDERCEALRLRYALIGAELAGVGIDVNCAPLLDIRTPGAHDIIGDRALGTDADAVIRRGRAVHDGLLDAGVLPVIKHVPGHGRAGADSHLDLPVVDTPLAELAKTDFRPFAALADAPLAMTAHIVYPALDPDACATLSPIVIDHIRQTLGLTGLLMSDDLSMHALSGDFGQRTIRTLDAGCDLVLHCNGDMAEMQPIAAALRPLTPAAEARSTRALALRGRDIDAPPLAERYAGLAEKGGIHA